MSTRDEIEILPGVVGPRRFTTPQVWLAPETDHEVRAIIEYDEELRRYVCDEVTVRRSRNVRPRPGPVTTDALRKVPIGEMIQYSLLVIDKHGTHLRDLPNPDGREPWGRKLPEDLERRPADRTLGWVAQMYRLGHALGEPPTKTVQEVFKVSRTTAIRWVMAARDKGYLGPAEIGKAGG